MGGFTFAINAFRLELSWQSAQYGLAQGEQRKRGGVNAMIDYKKIGKRIQKVRYNKKLT